MISKYTQAKQRRDQLAPIFNKKGIDEFEETVWRNVSTHLRLFWKPCALTTVNLCGVLIR